MSTFGLIEYPDASPEVRAVYDDIMATRNTDWVNNFWKALAHDPAALKRTWETAKQVMGPGALDPLTKEKLYVAVSMSNQCDYCVASHIAGAIQGHDGRTTQGADRRGGVRKCEQSDRGRVSGRDRRAI